MGDVTRNLSRHEFACKCGCGLADPHPDVYQVIQDAVDKAGARGVIVTSGSRCADHNQAIGGAAKSQHLPQEHKGGYTCAADCIFLGVDLPVVVAALEKIPNLFFGGVGLYIDGRTSKVDRVHLDVRGERARWGFVDGGKTSFASAFNKMVERFAP